MVMRPGRPDELHFACKGRKREGRSPTAAPCQLEHPPSDTSSTQVFSLHGLSARSQFLLPPSCSTFFFFSSPFLDQKERGQASQKERRKRRRGERDLNREGQIGKKEGTLPSSIRKGTLLRSFFSPSIEGVIFVWLSPDPTCQPFTLLI